MLDSFKTWRNLTDAKAECMYREECIGIRTYQYTLAPIYYLCSQITSTTSTYYSVMDKLDRAVAKGTCAMCENTKCKADEYREGECSGIKNTYKCVKQPECRSTQKLRGATPTKKGVCSSVELCKSDLQYKDKRSGKCMDEPKCGKTDTFLQKTGSWGAKEDGYTCDKSLTYTSYTETQLARAKAKCTSGDKAPAPLTGTYNDQCAGVMCYASSLQGSTVRCRLCSSFRKYTGISKYYVVPRTAPGTAKGKCVGCTNAKCPKTGDYRDGKCGGTVNQFECKGKVVCDKDSYRVPPTDENKGGVCKLRPDCSEVEFLKGAEDEVAGTCTAHPTCKDTEYLAKDESYVEVKKTQCLVYAKVRSVYGATLEQAIQQCETTYSDCNAVYDSTCNRDPQPTTKTYYFCKTTRPYPITTSPFGDYYCTHEKPKIDKLPGTCKSHPNCQDTQYLESADAFSAGVCKNHPGCTDDTYLNVYGSKAGTCEPCANTVCNTGNSLAMYRTGTCDPTTQGYKCLKQPTCGANQYLDAASEIQVGVCRDHPQCSDEEVLEGKNLETKKGECSRCPVDTYVKDGVCTDCPSIDCREGVQFQVGQCAGSVQTLDCEDCKWKDGCMADHYRAGFCSGSSNDFYCIGQPRCKSDFYLKGADAKNINQAVCTPCSNVDCAENEYRTGSCGDTDSLYADGYRCLDQPTCPEGQELSNDSPRKAGECTLIPTTSSTSSTSVSTATITTTTTSSSTATATSSSTSASTATSTSDARTTTTTTTTEAAAAPTTKDPLDDLLTEKQKALKAATEELEAKLAELDAKQTALDDVKANLEKYSSAEIQKKQDALAQAGKDLEAKQAELNDKEADIEKLQKEQDAALEKKAAKAKAADAAKTAAQDELERIKADIAAATDKSTQAYKDMLKQRKKAQKELADAEKAHDAADAAVAKAEKDHTAEVAKAEQDKADIEKQLSAAKKAHADADAQAAEMIIMADQLKKDRKAAADELKAAKKTHDEAEAAKAKAETEAKASKDSGDDDDDGISGAFIAVIIIAVLLVGVVAFLGVRQFTAKDGAAQQPATTSFENPMYDSQQPPAAGGPYSEPAQDEGAYAEPAQDGKTGYMDVGPNSAGYMDVGPNAEAASNLAATRKGVRAVLCCSCTSAAQLAHEKERAAVLFGWGFLLISLGGQAPHVTYAPWGVCAGSQAKCELTAIGVKLTDWRGGCRAQIDGWTLSARPRVARAEGRVGGAVRRTCRRAHGKIDAAASDETLDGSISFNSPLRPCLLTCLRPTPTRLTGLRQANLMKTRTCKRRTTPCALVQQHRIPRRAGAGLPRLYHGNATVSRRIPFNSIRQLNNTTRLL